MAESDRFGRAIIGAGLFASFSVTFGFWAGPAWVFAWVVAVVVFLAMLIVGLPLYALAARFGRVNGWAAACGGAATALAPAAWLMLEDPYDISTRWIAGLVAFGLCGASSGLLFLLILRWPVQRLRVGVSILAASGVAFAAAWIAQDHSCHNPVWYGRGIAPSASFSLSRPFGSWQEVATELDSFAHEANWSIRREQTPTAARPWLTISVCDAEGTDFVLTGDADQRFELFTYQPQGGKSWQPPMRAVHDRLRRRWPESISYRDAMGRPSRTPPDWLTRPVTPKPSAAAR